MKSFAAEGPETPLKKKRCLFYTASKKHRKLEVLQSLGESRRGWLGSGSRRIRGARSWPWHCRTAIPSSPKERGAAAPAADHPPHRTIKNSRVLRCFLLFPFFDSCGLRWVNMGQHKMGPRWANIAPRWANIALRWAQIALKIGQHSPKMGQDRPT